MNIVRCSRKPTGVIVPIRRPKTPLNLADRLHRGRAVPDHRARSPDSIDLAEDRKSGFGALLAELNIPCPDNSSVTSADEAKGCCK